MRPAPLIAVAIVAVILCAAVLPNLGHVDRTSDPDTDPEPAPDTDVDREPTPVPEPVGGYPEGIAVDQSTCTITYTETTSWHVYDLFETYYVKPEGRYTWSLYEGFDLTGSSIVLEPGYYRVSVDGLEFDVGFAGFLERTSSWSYDIGGTKHPVSIAYRIDVAELIQKKEASRAYNLDRADEKTLTNYLFSDLPGLVDVDYTVVSVERSLRSEFERIGGDASDRQAYADFIASFAQLAISYPPSIRLEGEDDPRGEDYGPYGMGEYWARPSETLCIQMGDCDDTSVLVCALYVAAGYEAAVGGISGHVFAGVALDGFVETSRERLIALDSSLGSLYKLAVSVPVKGSCGSPLSETLFYAVETTHKQVPVGYLTSGSTMFGQNTKWGMSGFYPYQGAESGIQGPS